VDQLRDHLLLVLGNPHVQDWLWISLSCIALALLYRPTLKSRLRSGRPPGTVAWIVLAGFLAIVSRRATPTGDEPHYLIMTQSLLSDGDFDLRNNYENQDYQAYHPHVIPDPHVIVRGARWYPAHAIGLPILAAPVYAVGGRDAVVVLQALLTVAGLRILWSVLRLAGFEPRVAGAVTLVAGLTLPVAAMAGQVFPEMPAFLLVIIALRAILAQPQSRWDRLGLLLSVGLLPWLHPKYALLGGALLLSMALVRPLRATIATVLGAATLLIVSVIGHAVLSYRWYGAPLPGASILVAHGSSPASWLPAIVGHFFVSPWVGLLGVLFDQQSGLFFASPVYLLAVPGFVLLWRRERDLAVVGGLVFASVYLLAGSYGIWYGGYSSPARLLTPAVPVLALAVASMLESADRWSWKLFAVLAVPSFLHAYLMTALPSFTRYGDPLTDHNFFIGRLERIFRLDLTPFFPSFRHVEPITWLTAACYVLGIAALSVVVVRRNRKAPSSSRRPTATPIGEPG
jgi:hypothetical protein